jgi:hypothetical protein
VLSDSECKTLFNGKKKKHKTNDEVKKQQWRFVRVRYTVKNLLLLSQNIYKRKIYLYYIYIYMNVTDLIRRAPHIFNLSNNET